MSLPDFSFVLLKLQKWYAEGYSLPPVFVLLKFMNNEIRRLINYIFQLSKMSSDSILGGGGGGGRGGSFPLRLYGCVRPHY